MHSFKHVALLSAVLLSFAAAQNLTDFGPCPPGGGNFCVASNIILRCTANVTGYSEPVLVAGNCQDNLNAYNALCGNSTANNAKCYLPPYPCFVSIPPEIGTQAASCFSSSMPTSTPASTSSSTPSSGSITMSVPSSSIPISSAPTSSAPTSYVSSGSSSSTSSSSPSSATSSSTTSSTSSSTTSGAPPTSPTGISTTPSTTGSQSPTTPVPPTSSTLTTATTTATTKTTSSGVPTAVSGSTRSEEINWFIILMVMAIVAGLNL